MEWSRSNLRLALRGTLLMGSAGVGKPALGLAA